MNVFHRLPPIGEARDREMLRDAETYLYKETEHGPLHAHVFHPPHQTSAPSAPAPRAAMICFHGGFWDTQAVTQFVPQCLHFAQCGIVTIVAETRVHSKHASTPIESIQDAQELVMTVKKNAENLNIDPQKIILLGAAGGAFLCLHCAMPKQLPKLEGFDPRPAALILLSALVNTADSNDHTSLFPSVQMARRLSPSRLTRRKLPPMCLLQGLNDRITPVEHVRSFRRWLRWKGNKVELREFIAADHRFFNFNTSHVHFDHCLQAMEQFLIQQRLLEPEQLPERDEASLR